MCARCKRNQCHVRVCLACSLNYTHGVTQAKVKNQSKNTLTPFDNVPFQRFSKLFGILHIGI